MTPSSLSVRRSPLLAAPAVLLVLAGCAGTPTADAAHDGDAGTAWSYDGPGSPEHWGDLSDEYDVCSTGTEQSPVDLPAPTKGAPLDLVAGAPAKGLTADNGHTVQFTADDGATTRIGGEDLHLVQMHFHAGSEHTVRGKAADAEFHFVHADGKGALTVVGVLAEQGAHNAAYDSYVAGSTAGAGRASTVDIGAMLPEGRSHHAYSGSLTTPPCTEGVQWIVLEDTVELGADQLADLEAAHVENARPVQPLGDRTVEHELR
ncbi:carbonic anhydrase [Curtobacterium sp. PhB130]|uniref:carbonic anhydrase n=1 Tax=Curtobacterium sp. PhB130 TaxID=2485178 RepID=UPI000FB52124|nr:carbonic anhydrase family protein [Curtobacterium sp. PhB130]ROS77582.1 carbonic anhydrase [Curtobacterium sp. PhB130]